MSGLVVGAKELNVSSGRVGVCEVGVRGVLLLLLWLKLLLLIVCVGGRMRLYRRDCAGDRCSIRRVLGVEVGLGDSDKLLLL